MNVYSKTDIGLQREENQDTVWSERLSETACVAVLCDGMGGERAGGLASQMAVDIISKRIKESFSEMMNRNSVRNLLITAVSAAKSIRKSVTITRALISSPETAPCPPLRWDL